MADYNSHTVYLRKLKETLNNPVLFVHYSCESFYDYSKPNSRRITSIAVRYGGSSQTRSFSLHLSAEELKCLEGVGSKLDECEKHMLNGFYDFVKEHNKAYNWIHWNMRDSNYGFEAISHRFKVLGGVPVSIEDERKFDLSPALINIYGKNYSGHPRMEWLVSANNISRNAFLTGAEEAEAFAVGNFVAMHQSTLIKVQAISDIAYLARDQKLKTKSKIWRDVYCASISSWGQAFAANWLFVVCVALISIILSVLGLAVSLAPHSAPKSLASSPRMPQVLKPSPNTPDAARGSNSK